MCGGMANWTFLSNHGRALLCISRDPTTRLRDIAAELGMTERRAYDIVNNLGKGGLRPQRTATDVATAMRSKVTCPSRRTRSGCDESARCWKYWVVESSNQPESGHSTTPE